MKKSVKLLALALLVVLVLSSCTTFKLSGVQVVSNMQNYNVVGEFDKTVKVWEFLGSAGGANLGNVTADAMDEKIYDAIQREISKYSGDAAVNITVEYSATVVDLLINGFTGSIVAPATARITGSVVKYN
ncbi:hypothetical protein [Salinispira pacifica]|uniref:Lipoprotein n=1 Tax=Salinispira pacifica TaxID=1307761 RepID=V5WG64_9SPIO|nr:hypothetical protein [Salinispira pacifica]AHC14832.1 hypothetical protein L21SP2_1435 [Salinispira pacifica]